MAKEKRWPIAILERLKWSIYIFQYELRQEISRFFTRKMDISTSSVPGKYNVRIISDQPNANEILELEENLINEGFINVERLSMAKFCSREIFGFKIGWGAASHCEKVSYAIQDAVKSTMKQLGACKDFSLLLGENYSNYDMGIELFIPVDGISDGTYIERISSPENFNCTIQYHETSIEAAKCLQAELESFGFQTLEIKDCSDRSGKDIEINHGCAPVMLLDELDKVIKTCFCKDANRKMELPTSSRSIIILLQKDVTISKDFASPKINLDFFARIDSRNPVENSFVQKPFIEVDQSKVRVGSINLKRSIEMMSALIPSPHLFTRYCIDENTALILEHIASSVLLKEPCLLEGETSTSKSTSILFLASLLNQPVVRLNLNGQTDTGDLIGRWVPQSVNVELPFSTNELQEASTLLEEESNMILDKASRRKRELTRVEVQQIMANERIPHHPWRWQNGLIVQALLNGWWVILDELNLAEPQILERMNSLLEHDPELVMYENDGAVYGPSGKLIHPEFRIFGTMNPAEYSGRVALSPAYRNRWRGYRNVPAIDETSYFQMLRRLVFGEQPNIDVLGYSWSGKIEFSATHAILAEIPNINDLLLALVRFHVALENATGQRIGSQARIGVRRKEKYVFTRRDILSVMDFLVSKSTIDSFTITDTFRKSIQRYYIDRIATNSDKLLVIELLDAAGIGPNIWTLTFSKLSSKTEKDTPDRMSLETDNGIEGKDEIDPLMSYEEMYSEIRGYLVELKVVRELNPRAILLYNAFAERFKRPSTRGLRLLDWGIGEHSVKFVYMAFRMSSEEEKPWMLVDVCRLNACKYPFLHQLDHIEWLT